MFRCWMAIVAACLLIIGPGTPNASMSVSHADAAALLVLDLQVDFLDPGGRMPIAPGQIDQVLTRSNRAIEAAATHNIETVYVGNEYTRWDLPGNWFRHDAALGGTPGAALDPRVRRLSAAPYFSKHEGDAFSNPALERFLRSHHIRHVIICGVYADACVTATARGALRRGFAVTVLTDAVGAASDTARQSAVVKIGRAGAQIETTGEFINFLSRAIARATD